MSNRCIAWHEPKKISSSWSEMCSNNNNNYFWMHLHTYLVPLYSFTLFYIFYTILLSAFVNTYQRPTKSSTKPLAKEIPGKPCSLSSALGSDYHLVKRSLPIFRFLALRFHRFVSKYSCNWPTRHNMAFVVTSLIVWCTMKSVQGKRIGICMWTWAPSDHDSSMQRTGCSIPRRRTRRAANLADVLAGFPKYVH